MITSLEHLLRFDHVGGLNNSTDWKILAFFNIALKRQADSKGSGVGAAIMANVMCQTNQQ